MKAQGANTEILGCKFAVQNDASMRLGVAEALDWLGSRGSIRSEAAVEWWRAAPRGGMGVLHRTDGIDSKVLLLIFMAEV